MAEYTEDFVKELRERHVMFSNAGNLEDVLCLSTMIANGNPWHAEKVEDSRDEYLRTFDGECTNCPYFEKCLACFINE